MGRNLADWNRGMTDAEAGRLAAHGRSRDYYDGYDYACAFDYEIGTALEFVGKGDIAEAEECRAEAAMAFSAQLDRLNMRLLASEGARPPAPGQGEAAESSYPPPVPDQRLVRQVRSEPTQ